tara:strand:+ start:167 stop:931 length:765 start_codon:yes stop_codon:yes gene_type:complete
MDRFQTLLKIKKTRDNLRKDLESEWDTSVIIDLSELELEKLYTSKQSKNVKLSFGVASVCNFTLEHKFITNHKLHVIYYNFPELGNPPIKITKTCEQKVSALYTDKVIEPEDSLLIVLFDQVGQTLNKAIEDAYYKGQEQLKIDGLSEDIREQNELLKDNKYSQAHFRNIHIFHLDALAIDITSHNLVPKHEAIRDEPTIQNIINTCNAGLSQLPIILRNDPQAKILRLAPGDICKITRVTATGGEVPYYRVCR